MRRVVDKILSWFGFKPLVPWKKCKRHTFIYLYGRKCPHCLNEPEFRRRWALSWMDEAICVALLVAGFLRGLWERLTRKGK